MIQQCSKSLHQNIACTLNNIISPIHHESRPAWVNGVMSSLARMEIN